MSAPLKPPWIVTSIKPRGRGVTICSTPGEVLAALADVFRDPEGIALVELLELRDDVS